MKSSPWPLMPPTKWAQPPHFPSFYQSPLQSPTSLGHSSSWGCFIYPQIWSLPILSPFLEMPSRTALHRRAAVVWLPPEDGWDGRLRVQLLCGRTHHHSQSPFTYSNTAGACTTSALKGSTFPWVGMLTSDWLNRSWDKALSTGPLRKAASTFAGRRS